MFDLNLMNKSGLQIEENMDLHSDFIIKETSSHDSGNSSETKNNRPWYILVVIIFLLFNLYVFFLLNNSSRPVFEKKYKVDVSEIFNIISKPNYSIIIEKLNFNNDEFNFKIKTLNKNSFYNIMDDMSQIFGSNVMGVNINNIYTINMNLINQNYNESKIAVDELSKELSDFNIDIKKELYNNKLILVLDKLDLYVVINFLIKLNLINSYSLDIQLIQNISNDIKLYQMIIK